MNTFPKRLAAYSDVVKRDLNDCWWGGFFAGAMSALLGLLLVIVLIGGV